MILQHIKKIRPNLDVPFFEDSAEGKARADAIIQLALNHPELVIGRETMPIPATELTWEGTWTFAGLDEFKNFMQLAYDADPTLRNVRAKYIIQHGHEMLIETEEPGVNYRDVQVHITPIQAVRYDGTVISAADIQNL
jgi:hypothetical protein